MKFVEQYFRGGYNPSGVYRLVFDGAYVYYGSTVNVKSRMSRWKTVLGGGTIQNEKIKAILPTCKEVVFELVEVVGREDLRGREGWHIGQHVDASSLLNVVTNWYGPVSYQRSVGRKKGFKNPHTTESKKRIVTAIREMSEDGVLNQSKRRPVNQYDKKGNFIKTHISVCQAARDLGLDNSNISKIANGNRGSVGGFVFKYV